MLIVLRLRLRIWRRPIECVMEDELRNDRIDMQIATSAKRGSGSETLPNAG